MIKKTKYLFIFLFLLSCGYSPIYQSEKKINFKLGTIKGEDLNVFDASFEVAKKEIIITKDKKGDPSSFRTIIEMNLDLTYQRNGKVFSKKFIEESTYDSMENKFELNKYKNKLEKNMIFKILGDINIFFNIVQNDL